MHVWGFAAINTLIQVNSQEYVQTLWKQDLTHCTQQSRYVFHLIGHHFIVKCQQAPAYPFSGRVLFFKWLVPGSEGWGKKGKPWNNAVWLWLVVNRLWKMGNKFLRGILHSSSPCTSCVVSIIAKDPQTVEWKSRMSMGGKKKLVRTWNIFMFRSSLQNVLFCVFPGIH